MNATEKQTAANKVREAIAHSTGSDHLYRHGLNHRLVYTDGVADVAEVGGAWWLVDLVASYVGVSRPWRKAVAADDRFEFLSFWSLAVTDGEAEVTAVVDSGCPVLIHQHIEYTDFPLDELKLFLVQRSADSWCLMLPSEY